MRILNGQEVRQLIDLKQAYQILLDAEAEQLRNFRGSMTWKTVHGREYLYRKGHEDWKIVGVRSAETVRAFNHFHEGRAAIKARIEKLKEQIERMAPVCRAMGLGRMPSLSARILRRLDAQGILGRGLSVVGTHALFAYESLVAAHLESEHVATADIDLLYDARASLKLVAPELKETGLIAQLKKVDRSFSAAPGAFRASNNEGFLVDLIMPQSNEASLAPRRRQISDKPEDQAAAELKGLEWLQSSPSISEIVVDERGFPVRIFAPDPRAFAVHKAWLSQRDDRDPGKRRRDRAQAIAVAKLVREHLPDRTFGDQVLQAFPLEIRTQAISLIDTALVNGGQLQGPW